MLFHAGQNGARGQAVSSSVHPVVRTPVMKSSSRSNRHTHVASTPTPMNGQLPQMMTQGRASHIMRFQAASTEMAGSEQGPATKVHWYKKKQELWIEADTADELKEMLANNTSGKAVMVDFYAGWCSSCKTAYPALCKLASDLQFTKDFVFAKADIQRPGVLPFLRAAGVRGIPTIVVYDTDGEMLVSFGASFRKMNIVKANLVVLAANAGAKFFTDPNGFVIPKPE